MKVRDLKRKAGSTSISVWPPTTWASSMKPGDKLPIGNVGVLTSVTPREDGLSLTMEYDGRTHNTVLRWDQPPTLEKLHAVLQAHVGRSIEEVGNAEV